jgi:hypothetical protein
VYHKGIDNRLADALSRRPGLEQDGPHLQLNAVAVSTIVPNWLLQIVQGYEQDPNAQQILQKLATGTSTGRTLSQMESSDIRAVFGWR